MPTAATSALIATAGVKGTKSKLGGNANDRLTSLSAPALMAVEADAGEMAEQRRELRPIGLR